MSYDAVWHVSNYDDHEHDATADIFAKKDDNDFPCDETTAVAAAFVVVDGEAGAVWNLCDNCPCPHYCYCYDHYPYYHPCHKSEISIDCDSVNWPHYNDLNYRTFANSGDLFDYNPSCNHCLLLLYCVFYPGYCYAKYMAVGGDNTAGYHDDPKNCSVRFSGAKVEEVYVVGLWRDYF